LHFSKNLEQVFVVRGIVDIVMIDISYDTLLIDDKNDAITETVVGQDAEFLSDFAMGPEIG
jgi:hypothetical protein